MGILRTDKISGLETPTAVTGSVNFPGSDDYITAPANTPELLLGDADFTIEGWFYKTGTGQQDAFGLYETANDRRSYLLTVGDDSTIFYYNYTGSSGTDVTADATLPLNKWAHVVITRDGTTLRMYIDGKLSGTRTGLTSGAFANTTDQFMIGSSDYSNANGSEWTGHISNLRIVKGYVLYDGDFTVPDHALKVVPGTVLLACNNPDSVTAAENALAGKGLTLTAVNDVAVTSVTPGLTKDFTFGTEFRGVTTFDTQGYFVPPSGTTEQQFPNFDVGSGRGIFMGGLAPAETTAIESITISTFGNAQDFGDLSEAKRIGGAFSSSTRAVAAGGFLDPANTNVMEYITIASAGDAKDFGDLNNIKRSNGGLANSTRGISFGGTPVSQIEFVTIASDGVRGHFGNLVSSPFSAQKYGSASSTRGLMAGGETPSQIKSIDLIMIASTGDAIDFGDLTDNTSGHCAVSSPTRIVFVGGEQPSPVGFVNVMEFVTIAALGNATNFGDLSSKRRQSGTASSSTRGIIAGGSNDTPSPNTAYNTIDYITIATTGDSQDFGDLTLPRWQIFNGTVSDSHGGLG